MSPLEDRVLLLKDEAQQITSGGLYIPEMAQVKPNTAQVVAVGPGKVDKKGKIKPLDVKVGDRVLLTQYAGTEFKFEGHELIMLREDEILGVQE
ncbi:MAG: co-chaperone GroES [Bdellovibrionales bacterium]|nr:co-chaperone GroES [Bdellovibrionales bacterium]